MNFDWATVTKPEDAVEPYLEMMRNFDVNVYNNVNFILEQKLGLEGLGDVKILVAQKARKDKGDDVKKKGQNSVTVTIPHNGPTINIGNAKIEIPNGEINPSAMATILALAQIK